jgi:hypothetical protein
LQELLLSPRTPFFEVETNMKVSEELERNHHEHRPFWKRAHHDWKFWAAMILMLTAMFIYVMTDDLAFVPRIHSHAASGTTRNSGAR